MRRLSCLSSTRVLGVLLLIGGFLGGCASQPPAQVNPKGAPTDTNSVSSVTTNRSATGAVLPPTEQESSLPPKSAVLAAPPAKGAAALVRSLAPPPTISADTNQSFLPYPRMKPVPLPAAEVVSVDAQAQFVVLESLFGRMPAPGTTLSLYRQGQPVAQVRISHWGNGRLIVADVIEGTAKVGDVVPRPPPSE